MRFLAPVAIVMLVVLLVRWLMLRAKLKELERKFETQLAELTRRVWALEHQVSVPPQPAEKQPAQAPEPVVPVLPPPPPLVMAPEPASAPERSFAEILGVSGSDEWEALIGGSVLNKLGALILVIGIALILGYSFGHLTATGRAAIALAVSLVLLGGGVFLERRDRYRIFSRGLIGAGWAALYATAYAIYALPEARIIEDPFVGSLGMLAVAAGMVAHSLRYRSQAVTAVAYFAAFAALAATPSSPFAVVSLVPLAASLLYLASRFEWYWLPLFGLAATYLTCISRGQSGASLASAQAFFLAYWLLFEGFDLLRVKRRAVSGGLHLVFPLNTIGFLGLSYLGWSTHAAGDR